jgi:hypothetical protein
MERDADGGVRRDLDDVELSRLLDAYMALGSPLSRARSRPPPWGCMGPFTRGMKGPLCHGVIAIAIVAGCKGSRP